MSLEDLFARTLNRPPLEWPSDGLEFSGTLVADVMIYVANGWLILLYNLSGFLPTLLCIGCASLIILVFDQRTQQLAAHMPQRRQGGRAIAAPQRNHQALTLATLLLWLLAQSLYPAPVPYLGLAMWLCSIVGLMLLPAERAALLWRNKVFILSYSLALLGFRMYLVLVASATPQAWASVLGSIGEAERVIAGNLGLVNTIGAWATWFMLPVAHLLYVIQRLTLNPMSVLDPRATAAQIAAAIRSRAD